LVRAPGYFGSRNVGSTIATKTTGNKLSSENLKGRVFSVSLADLKSDESQSFRLIKLRAEEVQDVKVLTNFHGLTLTSDKLKSLVRKWQSLIETIGEVKTADGYVLRIFVIAFTQRKTNQAKKTYYAQSSQIRQIRKRISDIVKDTITPLDLNQAVEKILHGAIEKSIETSTRSVYPLTNVYIRKVKVLKTPKFDLQKLLDTHNEALFAQEDKGAKTADPKAKGGDKKDGAKKDGAKKDGDKKDGAKKEGAKKDGAKKEGAKKDGAKKEGAKKEVGKKEAAPKKDGAKKDAAKPATKAAPKAAPKAAAGDAKKPAAGDAKKPAAGDAKKPAAGDAKKPAQQKTKAK